MPSRPCWIRPQVAKAADNVGCDPPQIPLSKPLKKTAYSESVLGLDLNSRTDRHVVRASLSVAVRGRFENARGGRAS